MELSDIEKVKLFITSLIQEDLSDEGLMDASKELFKDTANLLNKDFMEALLSRRVSQALANINIIVEFAYRGSPVAQLLTGVDRLFGLGSEKNESEGIFWLERSYRGRNATAAMILYTVYASGIGVFEDMVKARSYLNSAADLNVPKAQYMLALMSLSGEGGEVDEDHAIEYMYRAAKNHCQDAIEFLSRSELILS
ncbi:sel1 repeat family protein [Vibrio sp. S9_S30]|uniref:tetratricopeptide repeat protein n=1 Tax=Vibrio sp. S9_S30 TaxID=2720226 RepID=UPI00168068FA|nr:tetratricopeptide repeat protein [Vibrio sp. S9_S30]MBD1558688.1 sel1 repeat family protein [Vibrio sp. S9_S30]